ncbi:hypothetical protein AAHZ94_22175 [Streptomyces sp. HSW2009]|uniref:hypothetical protein n=1 Tax=Streptomyces sp. HSW2009 TaxID=3142890 RepID=UPI0032EC0655
MRLFDAQTLAAVGPEIKLSDGLSGFGCLVETPDGPAAVDVGPDRIRLWDPRRGTLLGEVACGLPFDEIAAAETHTVDGVTVLFLHGKIEHPDWQWQAYDLHTGRPLPLGDAPDPTYALNASRIRVVGDGFLVVPAENRIIEGIDVSEVRVARVHRLADGTPYGEVELSGSGATFTTAVIDGTPFLVTTGYPAGLFALPSLELKVELAGATDLITLGAINGRPVVIAETFGTDGLGLWYVDQPGPRATTFEVPNPRHLTDLLLTRNGTLWVGTIDGLWAIPAEELVRLVTPGG